MSSEKYKAFLELEDIRENFRAKYGKDFDLTEEREEAIKALFGSDVDTGFEIPDELEFALDAPRETI